jgi:hypothetical protein
MMAQIDYGNPTWIERSMKTAKLMRDTWTDFNDKGQRQFRANYFGAATVGSGEQANDSWINYRAIRPAKAVRWYNQNPAISDLLVELADTWLAASMSTDRGKPEGVVPTHIAYPSGMIGGVNSPEWYQPPPEKPGITNEIWEKQSYKGYVYDLLSDAYGVTGEKRYLEPLRLEYELAAEYGNVPESKSGARLQSTSGDEPAAAKKELTPMEELKEGSREWAARSLKGVSAWLVAEREAQGRTDELTNDVTKEDIVKKANDHRKTLREMFPLTTTEAGPTDRVGFNGCVNPLLIMTGGKFGGPMIECAVTYRNTTRHFAAAVMGADPQGFRLLYHSLAPDQRTVGLVPWQLEPGGRYVLRYGPDADEDEKMDSVAEEREFDFPQRATEVPIQVAPRVTYLVEVDQITRGKGAEMAPDPALSDADLRYAPYATQVLARVHNVGSIPIRGVEAALYEGDPNSGGKRLQTAVIPNIEAPNDLQPRSTTVGFVWTPTEESHELFVVIDPDGKIQREITTFNNVGRIAVKKGDAVIAF